MKMSFSRLALALSLAAILSTSAHASFFDRLKDRVGDAVENAVSGTVARKASKEASEATEAVISPQAAPQSEEPAQAPTAMPSSAPQAPAAAPQAAPSGMPSMGGMGGFGGMLEAMQKPAPYDQRYSFDYELETEMTYDGEVNTMVQAFAKDSFYAGIDAEQKMILDLKNQSMVMVNDSKRTVSAMSTDVIKKMASMGGAMAKSQGPAADQIKSIKRTGQTKEIAGYKTEQWVFEGDDTNGELWVAESLDFDFVDFNKRMMALFDSNGQFAVDFTKLEGKFPNGIPLEAISYKNGKVESTSKTIRVTENPAAIDLSSYKAQSMMDGF